MWFSSCAFCPVLCARIGQCDLEWVSTCVVWLAEVGLPICVISVSACGGRLWIYCRCETYPGGQWATVTFPLRAGACSRAPSITRSCHGHRYDKDSRVPVTFRSLVRGTRVATSRALPAWLMSWLSAEPGCRCGLQRAHQTAHGDASWLPRRVRTKDASSQHLRSEPRFQSSPMLTPREICDGAAISVRFLTCNGLWACLYTRQ